MRQRKGVVRNSNIFMDQLSKATKAFSEIQLYNVNKRYVKQVFQVPIDLRFLQVENIIEMPEESKKEILENKIVNIENIFHYIHKFLKLF